MSAAVHALKALLVCAEDEVRQIATHLNLIMKCVHDYCLISVVPLKFTCTAIDLKVTETLSSCIYSNVSLKIQQTTSGMPVFFFFSQECLDCTFSWFCGLASFPLLPSAQEEEDEEDEGMPESMRDTPKEKEERKSDHDVARQDVVKVNARDLIHILYVFLGFLMLV